jgi:hypothetical protein
VNALLLGLFLGFMFLGFETYYRFIYDTTDSFTLTKTTQAWFKRHVQLNRLGLRDNVEYQPAIPPEHRRIIFLGDSFDAGHGVDDVDRRFANLLRRRHPEWDVMTLALFGWETSHEIEAIKMAIQNQIQLDVVVLVYCLNDISDLLLDWNAKWPSVAARFRSVNWFVQHSYFINTYYFRLVARHDPDIVEYGRAVKDAYATPLWEQEAARLGELTALVESRGGRLVAVAFPAMERLGPDYDWGPAHQKLAAYWAGAGVPYLDLLPVFSPHAHETLTVNRFDAHPNERAHALAAEAIDAFLSKSVAPK